MKRSVSAVIVTKDRPDEVGHCIGFMTNQSRLPDELIVVDSSSADATRRAVSGLSEHSPFPIRYIPSEPGIAKQRKAGIEHSRMDLVLFIDDDVEVEKHFVMEIAKVFESGNYELMGGVTGHCVRSLRTPAWRLGRIVRNLLFLPSFGSGRFRLSGLHTTANGLKGVRRVEYMGGAFTAYRKSVMEDVPPDAGTFPGPFEDVDLSYRVSRKYKNYYTEHARCAHIPSPVNRKSSKERSVEMDDRYQVFWTKNIPKNPLRRAAFRVASYGIRRGVCFMTDKDIVCFLLESVLGEKNAMRLRSLYRRLRAWPSHEETAPGHGTSRS